MDFLFQHLPFTEAQFTMFMDMAWRWITPFGLTLSAIILFIRITGEQRWGTRMGRASFLLILSYAVLMDRVWLRNIGVLQPQMPEWHWTLFYPFCTVFYTVELIIHHVFPFLVRVLFGFFRLPWLARLFRIIPPERDEKGTDHA